MRAEAVQVQGRPVRLWRGGQGPRLVLLQGGMADAELHWAPIWDRFAETFEVVAPDWPGFGGSAALPDPTWPAMLGWLDAFIDEQAGGAAHVVGNSFGGTVGRLFAAHAPRRVGRLVLINGGGLAGEPTAQALRDLPDDPAALAHLGRASLSREALARMVPNPTVLTDAFVVACQARPVILSILRASLAGPSPTELTPAVPTLVLWGEADRHTPPDVGRIVATAIPGAQFFSLPSLGHLPQLENPAAVAATVTHFLTDETP